MDATHVSAIAALAGSFIGGMASIATTWLTQFSQTRAQRVAQTITRREQLYEEFIEEAARLFIEALSSERIDPSKFVHLYGTLGKMRLFASKKVISMAQVMLKITDAFYRPNVDFMKIHETRDAEFDILKSLQRGMPLRLACVAILNTVVRASRLTPRFSVTCSISWATWAPAPWRAISAWLACGVSVSRLFTIEMPTLEPTLRSRLEIPRPVSPLIRRQLSPMLRS